jgi:hypothetical protein
VKRREQIEKKTKKKLATSKTKQQNKQENKNMTKKELKELEIIYEQKRAACIWFAGIFEQALDERLAAFDAWKEAVKKSKAK